MSFRKSHASRLHLLPGRQGMLRATVLLLLTLGLSLFAMSKAGNPAVERLRTSILDVVTPVLAVAASPFDAVSEAGAWVSRMSQLSAENIALKNQNVQLLKWQSVAKEMEAENKSLKTLLKVVPQQAHRYVTVRMVSDLGGPFMHSALINGGTEDGITKDQAVINADGLIGRVVEAGNSSARVLLLNDINSRVPVMAEQAHEKSIMTGNNNELPTLSYLAMDSKIAVGERIVTSGDGGIFPAGIPVGVVISIDRGAVKVQPFVDMTRIEYVSAINYSF